MISIRSLCAATLLLAGGCIGGALLARAQGPPQNPPPGASQSSPADKLTPEDIAMGKQLFAANCASCHGVDATGQLGPNLHGVAQRLGETGVFFIIRNGRGGMPPVSSINDQRVWQVVGFVRTLGETGATEAATGDPVKGKAVYEANGCSVCHTIGMTGGGVGPQLTAIGRARAPKYLHDFLLDPGKNPPPDMTLPERAGNTGYLLVRVVTKTGHEMTGIRVNEDTFELTLRDVGGHFYTYDKASLKTIEEQPGKSVMPSYTNLSAADLDNLVAYLASLKGAQ
ncbi:MAG TPA: c-type cytochrome [Verrucomicrobiae bacterium]|nr:c-type cytochrome [Verrucomicrobiae bacterium]